MQQMQQMQQMHQLQQMQKMQQMQQMQQMQAMVAGPMGRGVQMVRYQTLQAHSSFAQPRLMMRPQAPQMMARKTHISIILMTLAPFIAQVTSIIFLNCSVDLWNDFL